MSMMVNPSGGGQVVAAGQPFKLRLPKKKAEAAAPDPHADEPADETPDTDDRDDADDA